MYTKSIRNNFNTKIIYTISNRCATSFI